MMKLVKYTKFIILWSAIFLLSACGKDCMPRAKMAGYDNSDCTLCAVFRTVFNAVSNIAAKANNAFSEPVITVVAVAFALWLVTYVLKYLASMETRDIKDVFQETLVKAAQVVFVVVALKVGAAEFFNWLINPIYMAILNATQTVLNATNSSGVTSAVFGGNTVASVPGGLPADMGNAIVKTMTAIENNIKQIRAFGSSLLCYSWSLKIIIIPRFSLLFSGLFFWVIAMVMIIILPFLMIDSVFQLGVAVALLAPAIGCYPFRITRQYSRKVWETFLNSAFSFLFVAMVTILLLSVMQTTIEEMAKEGGVTWADIMGDDEGKVDEYISHFGWFHNNVLKLVFVFVLIWALMNMGKEFANEMASSISSTEIGSSVGTMGASTARGLGTKAISPYAQGAWKGAKAVAANAGNRIAHARSRNADRREQAKFAKNFNRHGGYNQLDANGNSMAIYTKNRGIFGSKTYIRDANGNISMEKEAGILGKTMQKFKDARAAKKAARSGKPVVRNARTVRRIEKISNDYYTTVRELKVTTGSRVYNKGKDNEYSEEFREEELLSEKVIAKTNDAENILNKSGELDTAKVQLMMNGLDELQKDELKKQIAYKLVADTFGETQNSTDKLETRINGDVITTVEKFADGHKEITEVKLPPITAGGRVVVTRAIVRNNGKVTKLSSDGLFKRIDEYNVSSTTGASIAEIEAVAERYLDGKIKAETLVQAGDYYGKVADPNTESQLAPTERSLDRAFRFTDGFSGKEVGVYGVMNKDGEFLDRNTGKKLAEKVFQTDENGKKYQVYLDKKGREYTIRAKNGVNYIVYKNDDGALDWKEEATEAPSRELVVRHMKDGNTKRLVLKGDILSDEAGFRVYGRFDKPELAYKPEDNEKFDYYFNLHGRNY